MVLLAVAALLLWATAATLPLVMLLDVDAPPAMVASGSLSQGKCPSAAPFKGGGKIRTSSANLLVANNLGRHADIAVGCDVIEVEWADVRYTVLPLSDRETWPVAVRTVTSLAETADTIPRSRSCSGAARTALAAMESPAVAMRESLSSRIIAFCSL
jgi:hypothetical protein